MQGRRLGAYRVLSELGTGGMGTVYLAEVEEPAAGLSPGTRVALKVVHSHLLEERGFFKRFLREAEIGRRVSHENVVRTLDIDVSVVEGRHYHYLVMEYVEGRSLRTLLTEAKRLPETLVREIAEQVAAGLEAIHGAGVVHRDLKPENVMITDEERVRIMDLGIAHLQEATVALTVRGQFTGTLPYAAPEQFRGGETGPASDQYALGVVMYELITGRNPFAGETAASVLQAHLSHQPPLLADQPQEVTLFFSELVNTLLAKEPGSRFASAGLLRRVLREAERSAWWAEREAAAKRRQTGLPRIPVWRDMPMVGRTRELEDLRAAWAAARQGDGRVVWIEGEEGLGRTRLVDALFHALAGDELHGLYGAYVPTGGLGGLSESVVGKFGDAALAEGLRPFLAEAPSLVDGFAALVRQLPPPPDAAPVSGEAAGAVFLHLLRGLAKDRPLVWVVEDVEHAPGDSRRTLLALARGLARERALLVFTARPGALTEEEMGHFTRLPHFHRVALGRLSPREVVEALRGAFRSRALAERLGGKIAWKSDGVPQAMVDIFRGLEARGLLQRDSGGELTVAGSFGDIEVPSTAQELVRARLRDVTEEQRRLLDVGAVAGVSFTPDLVARVLEEKKVRVLQDLAAVGRRTGLVRADGHVYRFDGNRVREVLYGDLPLELREEYHAAFADAVLDRDSLREREPAGVPEETAAIVAHHHLRGSRPREGVPYLLRAVDLIGRTRSREERLEQYDLALRHLEQLEPAQRVDVLLGKCGAIRSIGRVDEALSAAQEAHRIAEGAKDPILAAKSLNAEGSVLMETRRFDEARAALERSLSLGETAGDERMAMRARWSLGILFIRVGDPAASEKAFLAVRDSARRLGDRNAEAAATNNLANAIQSVGRRKEAFELYGQALAIAREVKNRGFESNIRSNLAECAAVFGQLAEAVAEQRESVALQREFGSWENETTQVASLATLLALCGRFDEAQELLDAQASLLREFGLDPQDPRLSGGVVGVALHRGDFDVALAALVRDTEAPGLAPPEKASAWYSISWIELQRGFPEKALAALAAAETAHPASRDDDEDSYFPDFVRAAASGDLPKARAALDAGAESMAAVDRLRCRWITWRLGGNRDDLAEAERLRRLLVDHAPPEDRERMTERVPLLRDVAAAAGAAGLS